jgi:arylsulfatase A-like enzyme
MMLKSGIIGAALVAVVSSQGAGAAERPNILFVMSDDHTSQAVGAYGSRLAKLNPTPTIDSLAAEGVLMENAFCHNAICAPSRASIMTGQYSAINGVLTLREGLTHENQFMAHEMKKAGYQTAVIGKWHLKKRPSAFDYYKVLPGQGSYFNPKFFEGELGDMKGAQVKMQGHSSDCIADSALEWFKTKRDPSKPFFLKFHFKAPHDMFDYAPRYESYLEEVEIPEPASLFETGNHGSIATRGVNDELVHKIGTSVGRRNTRRNYVKEPKAPWADKIDHSFNDDEVRKQAYQEYLKAYLRCVKGVDDNLKRVIDYLKAEGLYDNTVILYTGDQGFYLGEHDFIDKRWGYEEGMRMPFIVRYPKSIKAGTRSDAIVENVDYGPTMLGFAGVETPDYMQGKSFKGIIETGREPDSWKKAAYYHYWMHMAHHDNPAHIAIRTKRHKLLFFYGALKGRLKQLRADYGEDDPKFNCNQVIDAFWDYDDANRQQAIEISNAMAKKQQRVKKNRNKE